MTNDNRRCVRNLVPHKTPDNANRYDWHNAHLPELVNMYNIFEQVFRNEFPNESKSLDTEYTFHNFSRLIYHCSSKHINE